MPIWTAKNSEGYASPVGLTVDAVVLTVRDGTLQVLVVQRPAGDLALAGGFVGPTESADQTAARTLKKKTGVSDVYLEQLGAFTDPDRDPRGWIPSIAYVALVPPSTTPTDPNASWLDAYSAPKLAFDHNRILADAFDRVAGKLWWSNIAVGILPGAFTLAEARQVYEAISGAVYDASTFGRDLRGTGLVEPTGGRELNTGGRPAALYAFVNRAPAWGAGRRKRVA